MQETEQNAFLMKLSVQEVILTLLVFIPLDKTLQDSLLKVTMYQLQLLMK